MSEMKNVVQKGGVKDMISKKHTKVTTGVFIPGEFLSQAEITEENIEIEVANKEIRIHPAKSNVEKKVFTFDSPLWKCVGFAEIEGVNGKDHDRYI
ncbi:MAG: hypothetical protein U9O90_11080 [Euryarchaeota archaeon]|nr:hypothetical protein [Euryarchaeota archaeon]